MPHNRLALSVARHRDHTHPRQQDRPQARLLHLGRVRTLKEESPPFSIQEEGHSNRQDLALRLRRPRLWSNSLCYGHTRWGKRQGKSRHQRPPWRSTTSLTPGLITAGKAIKVRKDWSQNSLRICNSLLMGWLQPQGITDCKGFVH